MACSMVKTGNNILDAELSLMSDEELGCLGKYLRFVREISVKFDDGYSWADMPLTPEEELAVMSTAAQKAGKQ